MNHIGQLLATSTSALYYVGSDEEIAICGRQNRRVNLFSLAPESDNFDQRDFKRGIGDDEDDQEDNFQEEDVIEILDNEGEVV